MSVRFVQRPTAHPDARRMLDGFYREIRGRFGFDVSRQAEASDMDPPGGRFLVGYQADEPVAAGGIRTWDEGVCEIKRMYVAPAGRRQGVGKLLLAELETAAREAGFRRIVLDTIDTLGEALALYDAQGYTRVPAYNENPYANVWFAKDLTD